MVQTDSEAVLIVLVVFLSTIGRNLSTIGG